MVALGEGAVSYERGAPVTPATLLMNPKTELLNHTKFLMSEVPLFLMSEVPL